MHQAGSDALLTLSTFYKFIKIYMKNSAEKKYMNVLEGIPLHTADDVWKKTIVPEYPYLMFNPGFGMHNMSMMDSTYFNQADIMYNGGVNNSIYKMHYYQGFGGNSFQDPNQNKKKFDSAGGKMKNQIKN